MSLDPTAVLVAGIPAVPLLIGQAIAWVDMRRRTNGHGPLAGKLDRMDAKIDDLLEWQIRHERDHRADR